MGLASAQDVFQNQSDQTFGDIPNVYCIADDILITAPSQKEDDAAIQKISQCAKVRGFKLGPEEANIQAPKVKFYRHILMKEGVQPDTQKVAILICISAPRDKQGLKSLVGCVIYFTKFIPNLSKHTHDMRRLLGKDVN